MFEYVGIYLNKQSSEYDRKMNVSNAVPLKIQNGEFYKKNKA